MINLIALILFMVVLVLFFMLERIQLLSVCTEQYGFFEPGLLMMCYEYGSRENSKTDLLFEAKIISRKGNVLTLYDGVNRFDKNINILLVSYKIELYDPNKVGTDSYLVKTFEW